MMYCRDCGLVAIPSSSGHWFLRDATGPEIAALLDGSQSLLHQVIGSFREEKMKRVIGGKVAIPSSSGHWFLLW